jgi:hypothetical protein
MHNPPSTESSYVIAPKMDDAYQKVDLPSHAILGSDWYGIFQGDRKTLGPCWGVILGISPGGIWQILLWVNSVPNLGRIPRQAWSHHGILTTLTVRL